MLKLSHKNLDVWKLSIQLVKEIYKLTEDFPKSESYGLINQIRRASVSVASNIAEGASRKSAIERKRFYEIARSSLIELDTQIEIALSLNYMTEEQMSPMSELTNHVFVKITNLLNKT